MIFKEDYYLEKGYQEILINSSDWDQSGILQCRLATPAGYITQKILLMRS
ncbi:MAG: hypothetical protein HKN16_09355 [Saprospiraceae bacterium]|nr:hypothetical protein [Saprospiraceae bacterium]